MKGACKSVVVLAVVLFVAAFVCSFAYACRDCTQGSSGSKTMSGYGREDFHKAGGHQFSGNGGGNKAGQGDKKSTGTGTGTTKTQTAGDPTNAAKYPDSASLDTAAWNALNSKDYNTAQAFAGETINRYSTQAAQQQASMKGFAPKGQESQAWALNDVATAYFISGSAYEATGNTAKATTQFQTVISKYSYAQAYDPAQNIYWHVADAAQKELNKL